MQFSKRQFFAVLQRAVKFNKVDTVKRMLKALNAHERSFCLTVYPVGGTLLHLAASQDFAQMVDTLLKLGVDPGIKNALGQTAFQVAQDHEAGACLAILAATPTRPRSRAAGSGQPRLRTRISPGGSTPVCARSHTART